MFKCSVMYGYDELMALNTLLEKTNRKPSIKGSRITLYIAGIIVIVAGIIAIPKMQLTFNAVIPLLIGFGLIYMGKKYVHFTVTSSLKNIKSSMGTMNFVLGKKKYEVSDRVNRVELDYLDLYDAVHYNGIWFLFRSKTQAFILPEDKFYEGDLAELPAFLEARMGKAPTYIK